MDEAPNRRAALGGGLLTLGTDTAGAQEVSADVSGRVGRSTSAEVRICADGRSCPAWSAAAAVPARAAPHRRHRPGRALEQLGRLRRGPGPGPGAPGGIGRHLDRNPAQPASASASGQASVARRARAAAASADTSPRASADATASLTRPRARRLLDLDPVASLAGVGLLGTSPFTLVGDPAADNLLPTGELTSTG